MTKRDITEETLLKCEVELLDRLSDVLGSRSILLGHVKDFITAHKVYEREMRQDLAQFEPEFPELLNQIPISWRN